MTFLSEVDATYSNNLLPDKEFRDFFEPLYSIFCFSRIPENRNSPERVLEAQELLGKFILYLEKSYKNGKDVGRMNTVAHKRLLRIARTIADGMVWRNTGFKRAWLEVLSYNKRNMLNEDYPQLLMAAKTDFQGKICFIGDLTETLRIGDLVVIDEENKPPLIVEAKTGLGGGIKLYSYQNFDENKMPSKQMSKILDTQMILNSGKIERQGAEIIDVNFPNIYNFDSVLKGIERAYLKGVEVVRFDKYTSVMIVDAVSPALRKNVDFTPSCSRARRIVKEKGGDLVLRTRSVDSFGFQGNHFLHSIAPYSIFPFPDEICMGLMTGDIQIYSYYNISGIMREFEKDGWQVERIEGDPNDTVPITVRNSSGLFGEPSIDGSLLKISKEGYWQKIPIATFYQLGFEFLSYKSIIGLANQTYREALLKPHTGQRGIATNFTSDKDWFI